jgi:2-polyprenyl-3-methyl-5-hydroxy-6-metoxy-1,4-benzoquinol methylase
MKQLYKLKDNDYFSWNRPELLLFVKEFYSKNSKIGSVLEVGSANGIFGQELKKEFDIKKYVGIEYMEDSAKEGSKRIDISLNDNIENLKKETIKILDNDGPFDLIIFADVLEHLVDPWSVLEKIKPYLKPSGKILISVPNMGNIEVVKKLIFDKFDYQESGILDKTHLRFFTHSFLYEFLKKTKFNVLYESNFNDLHILKLKLFNYLTFGFFKTLFIRQFYIIVEPEN